MDLSNGDCRNPELSEARADQAAGRPGAPLRIALALKLFVDHQMTKLGVGLVLIASGLIEAYDTVLDELHRLRVRVGHGVVILGVVHVLASLPEVIEGIERSLSYLEGREDSRPSWDGPDGGSKEGARNVAPGTRHVYASQARRFLRWAEGRGRTLDTITATDLEAYRAELAAEKSPRAASKQLSVVRSLLGQLPRADGPAAGPRPRRHPRSPKAMPAINGREPSLSLSELKEAVRQLGNDDSGSSQQVQGGGPILR
jgi:hypothetical protein